MPLAHPDANDFYFVFDFAYDNSALIELKLILIEIDRNIVTD